MDMAKAGNDLTRNFLRSVASWVERNDAPNGLIVNLEDGRYLTMIVVHDAPQEEAGV